MPAPTPPKVGGPAPAPTVSGKATETRPAITDLASRNAALKKFRPLSISRQHLNDPADVLKVQELLQAKLGPGAKVPHNGKMDDATVAAVKKVQAMANFAKGDTRVREDGIVGQQTYALLLGTPHELLPPPGVRLLDYSKWQPDEQFEGGTVNMDGLRGGKDANEQLRQFALKRIPELGLHISSTTGGEHAVNSRHYLGEAIDVGGPAEKLDEFYRDMQAKERELGVNAHELIYSPEGFEKEGQKVSLTGALKQEHFNHVHYSWNV